MTTQMWLALAMCVSGHVLLHFKAERYYRFAAAWMITGAFLLASGVAIPCWIECNVMRMEFSRAQAAEPGKRMSEQPESIPQWTMPVDGGVLSFSGGEFPGEHQWPAKLKNSTSTSF